MPEAPFKVAIRAEGQFVNAYVAPNAPSVASREPVLIASVRRTLCDASPEVFDAFKALGAASATAVAMQVGLTVLGVKEEAAPEHERAGHA